ncbi:hypothetical protein [Flavobacterium sp. ENC]|uniref:hypothetical protein n=1 Tax=Flavobacterium sp. ENC TaxID=2897330 RepID=UPI001E455D74|nr:hypothetical protein [Flavobacterium sp. ENC]MCD0465597.1 hypothetical protein [Flavobacterium sp. ENC]
MKALIPEEFKSDFQIKKNATQLANSGQLKPAVNLKDFSFENIEEAYNGLENHTLKNRAIIRI